LQGDENLTAEAACKEGRLTTGECHICSSVSLASVCLWGSRFARSEAGGAGYRQEDSCPPLAGQKHLCLWFLWNWVLLRGVP